jgi:competence protein ComEC
MRTSNESVAHGGGQSQSNEWASMGIGGRAPSCACPPRCFAFGRLSMDRTRPVPGQRVASIHGVRARRTRKIGEVAAAACRVLTPTLEIAMNDSRGPIDPAVLCGAGLVAGGLLPVAPWEVALAAAAVLALAMATGRVGRALAVLSVAGLAAGALRAGFAVTRHEVERAKADAALPSPTRCDAHARVTSSPVRVRGGLRWDARLDRVTCADARVAWEGPATLYGGPDDLARGDEADIVATLAPPQRFWNSSGGDPRPGEARRGIVRSGGTLDVRVTRRASGLFAWLDHLRARVRGRIEATFAPDLAPMARALVLGESDLAPDDDQAFRASGLSHLLAVSGMHLVLVLAVATRTLEGVLARIESVAARVDAGRIAAAVGVPATWIYSDLAGAGGSTVRAAWMMTVALLARALGRRPDTPRAFGLSLCVMALDDPLVAFDLSFALSAGATAGLLAFAQPLAARITARAPGFCGPIVKPVATTVAASLPCTPILARFAPTLPVGGAVANLIAVPLGEMAALPLCLVHAVLWGWPAAQRGCAIVASGALVLVRAIARVFAAPALTVQIPRPTSWQLAVVAWMFAAVLLQGDQDVGPGGRHRASTRAPRRPRRGRTPALVVGSMAALLGLEIGARRAGSPRGILRATFLDVGQGDAAIVDLPDGEAMIIDGGGLVGSPIDVGTRVVAPELRTRRRSALAAVVLTHPHPDHFGGLATGLDAVRVDAIWDTGQGQREQTGGGYAALFAEAASRGTPVVHPDRLCGKHRIGGAIVEVLAPCPEFSSDRGPNDNSIVVRLTYGARSMLFVGDAEREEEGILLETARGSLRADVLKVGHHGSRTSSSPRLLEAVAPREAVISVGCRNRFGHPDPITLGALSVRGVRVWRTDRDGAIVASTDGESLEVSGMASGR